MQVLRNVASISARVSGAVGPPAYASFVMRRRPLKTATANPCHSETLSISWALLYFVYSHQ